MDFTGVKYVIGVDPGKNGGIAVWDVELGTVHEVISMPETAYDLNAFFKRYSSFSCYCFLEKVGGMPGQGGSAMFNFGRGFGHIEMSLLANGIKTEEVSPQKWQKYFSLGSRKTAGGAKEWKILLKEKAQMLYPDVFNSLEKQTKKLSMAICDALLIMHFGVFSNR